MRLTGQGTGRKLGKYPVAIEAQNRQNPATFELEKFVVLLRRESIVTRRSLVVKFFRLSNNGSRAVIALGMGYKSCRSIY